MTMSAATAGASRALVAGAGGGIGAACVRTLRRSGLDVVGVDRNPDPDLETIDVTTQQGPEAAVARAEQLIGRIDACVHAVGMSGRRLGDGPVTTCTDEAWEEVLRVNLGSAFRLVRAAIPALRRAGGGSIVLIGSVLARSTDRDFLTAAYATSKAGLEGLARVAAREVAADGIRVNVVAPGLVDTPMAGRAASDPVIRSRLAELQPLGGSPLAADDVAEAVAWLASPAGGRVTGTVVTVDAGWTL